MLLYAQDAADLRTAAQAVVDRWDTPLWKDVPATAEYIGRLRAALAAGQATAAPAQPAAQPDLAYSAACNLATALFKKHFAHLPDFASGQAVWSLCDSTAGVISQIDNMVSGLVQPPTTSPQADNKKKDSL